MHFCAKFLTDQSPIELAEPAYFSLTINANKQMRANECRQTANWL
jgi:hypothetical protein